MAVRRIIRMGHPTLRSVARPVQPEEIRSPDFLRLIEDLKATLTDYGGIGLAAPQVDAPVRLAIIYMARSQNRYGQDMHIPLTICINPEIRVLDDRTEGYWEGCLSVPGLRGYVERPRKILVTYTDPQCQQRSEEFEGFAATVCQHEFDHLDGKLYIDRIVDPTKLMFEEEFGRYGDPAP